MSTDTTLADIFAGALGGYVDSQNNQPITATALTPNTAYGYAGYPQATPGTAPLTSALGSNSTLLILGAVVLAAVLLLRK